MTITLITGANKGLGRETARRLLEVGHTVLIGARDAGRGQRTADELGGVFLQIDPMSDASVAAAADQVRSEYGRLDVLVNNAGYGDVCSIEDTSLADFRAQIETNLFGVVNVTKAAIPLMREQGSGHIIQISSIGGRVGPPGGGAYSTAKWGVEGFSEVLVKEVGPLGIKVTLIEPGGMRTDFAGASTTIRDSRPEYDSTVGAMARYQRDSDGAQPGDPVKAAAVILHIASLDEPPLRLLLGTDAVHSAEQNDLARMEADRKWRELSVSTDFEAGGGSNAYPWEREANGTAHP
jgi:NAD(P)-dependent dehydrogenase (short-subunit alcohol dehydrogenase family)